MPAPLRFAVATFRNYGEASAAACELISTGTPAGCTALLIEMGGLSPAIAVGAVLPPTRGHAFADGRSVLCSEGIFANLLAERVQQGARSLEEAIGLWLLPRHALRLAEAIRRQQVLVWVQVSSPEEERFVSLRLLRLSRAPVEVHDIAGPHGAEWFGAGFAHDRSLQRREKSQ